MYKYRMCRFVSPSGSQLFDERRSIRISVTENLGVVPMNSRPVKLRNAVERNETSSTPVALPKYMKI